MRSILRKIFGLVPTLDLHGLRVRQALEETRIFLEHAQTEGHTEVRIIYGKGRGSPGGIGVLRQAVPDWLDKSGGRWVERFERQIDASGDDGAVRVWLHTKAGEDPG